MTKLILILAVFITLTISPGFAFTATTTSYASQEDGYYFAANGERLKEGMCAADWRYWPVGTHFSIEGKIYRVTDRGSAVIGKNHIDIFCRSIARMNARGTVLAECAVVGEKPRSGQMVASKHQNSRANEDFSKYSFTSHKNVVYSSKSHETFQPAPELVCMEF